MDAFAKIQQIAVERGNRGGLWPLFEPFGDRSKKYGDVLKKWVTPLVERALEHKRKMFEKGQPIQDDQSTLLEYLTVSFDGNLPPRSIQCALSYPSQMSLSFVINSLI